MVLGLWAIEDEDEFSGDRVKAEMRTPEGRVVHQYQTDMGNLSTQYLVVLDVTELSEKIFCNTHGTT